MTWTAFTQLLASAADDPGVILVMALCVFAAGALAGLTARQRNEPDAGEAGDTQANWPAALPPMRTANASLIDLQARRALKSAGYRPHARAGRAPLRPSYDGLKHETAADQSPDSPRA